MIISVVLSCCGGRRRRRWSSFRGRSAVTALGDKTSFGPPFVFCVLELSRKSPCLWACFHSLSPLSVVSAKKGNLYYNSAQSLLNGPPLSNFVDRGLGEWEWLGPGSTKINKDYLYIIIPLMVLQNGACPLSHNTATFLSLKPVLHNTGPF
jgi:hypothetical protein